MGLFTTFYKPRKARGFHFQPRYYDAEKEARDERIKRIQQEAAREKGEKIADDDYVVNFRGRFREHKQKRSRIVHKQNNRILIIFVVLLFFAYLLYKYL
ncbi:MAG: hypothetical protein LBR55_01485 [Bacteroidales bacterium]|jgi:hypothetical protein|nr:hypothetical protein [Bacteroidales bacterium]